jgi:hypothetical protein
VLHALPISSSLTLIILILFDAEFVRVTRVVQAVFLIRLNESIENLIVKPRPRQEVNITSKIGVIELGVD